MVHAIFWWRNTSFSKPKQHAIFNPYTLGCRFTTLECDYDICDHLCEYRFHCLLLFFSSDCSTILDCQHSWINLFSANGFVIARMTTGQLGYISFTLLALFL